MRTVVTEILSWGTRHHLDFHFLSPISPALNKHVGEVQQLRQRAVFYFEQVNSDPHYLTMKRLLLSLMDW
jgi:hypothetical protein